MKLFIFYSFKNKISREDYEVRETAKSFIYDENRNSKYFFKKDLDVLKVERDNSYTMISLSGNLEKFIRLVMQEKAKLIDKYQLKINQVSKEIDYIKSEYSRFLENHTDRYITDGFLFFTHKGASVCGNKQPYEESIEIIPNHLMNGEDFLSALKKGSITPANTNILNIFINGYQSNIGLETFTNEILDACIVNIEKFADIVLGSKVEIDIRTTNEEM